MSPAGFEPAIPAIERQQTHVLDCTITGIGSQSNINLVLEIKENELCAWLLNIYTGNKWVESGGVGQYCFPPPELSFYTSK